MKVNKKLLFITSLVTLVPIVVGLILWNQLPDPMATHFNTEGVADGYTSKLFAVAGMPLFMLLIHLGCLFLTKADPKNESNSQKILNLIFWICPVLSLVTCLALYPYNLGYKFNSTIIGSTLISIMFIIIGNYMPKCRQNYTIGIKLPWTLHDEENWNHTHRMAGYLWICGGLLMLANIFLKWNWLVPVVFIVAVLVPTIYSYLYYRKHGKAE